MSILKDKHILLGVTGSIAAYKTADLASKLTQAGAQVDVILTAAAEKFVTPLTFQSVTGRRAYTDSDLWGGEAHVLHVGLGHSTDLLVIAPCTADTLAKLAHGLADNLLTVTALAATCPLVIAPAMDGGMFDAPATQANLATLIERGATIIGPAEGHLASGLLGKGRMSEPAEVLGRIRMALGKKEKLAGRKIVVTAGGTQEPLDPVRVLTNHSSGKQGYALAQAALDLGADASPGDGVSGGQIASVYTAIPNARADGRLVVVSAGNSYGRYASFQYNNAPGTTVTIKATGGDVVRVRWNGTGTITAALAGPAPVGTIPFTANGSTGGYFTIPNLGAAANPGQVCYNNYPTVDDPDTPEMEAVRNYCDLTLTINGSGSGYVQVQVQTSVTVPPDYNGDTPVFPGRTKIVSAPPGANLTSSIGRPADSADALTVGAVCAEPSLDLPIQTTSSRGPVTRSKAVLDVCSSAPITWVCTPDSGLCSIPHRDKAASPPARINQPTHPSRRGFIKDHHGSRQACQITGRKD
jgi:3-polyprenyl-4-hydroxybenzoate decarboxylase